LRQRNPRRNAAPATRRARPVVGSGFARGTHSRAAATSQSGPCPARDGRRAVTRPAHRGGPSGTRMTRSIRTMLFVPAARWPMIERAPRRPADAICLDLEASVPPEEKAAARANCVRAFRELDFGGRVRMFRINGLDTSFAYRDLIDVVEPAGDRID